MTSLNDQIAFATSLLANSDKLQKLLADREKAVASLAKIDEELSELLPAAPTNGSGRADQKCSNCGQTGHSKRTCTNPPKGGN